MRPGRDIEKFFLAGRGMSVRTGRYLSEAVIVGIATGLAVTAFKYGIDFAGGFFEGVEARRGGCWHSPARWLMLVMPAAGALLGHLLIKRFSKLEHARGTDSAIRAFHQNDGYVTGTVILVKPVASILTVGSGGSAGYEGPVTLLGAACGSFIARKMKLSVRACRILMAAGMAAGIAALFQAPLAGAIFGFEIFYSSSDIEDETVLPCFIASAASYSVYAFLVGESAWNSIFTLDSRYTFSNGLSLLPYLALAIIVAFGSRFYITFFRAAEKTFSESQLPPAAKVVAGGLATGAIGFFFPDVLGTSYGAVRTIFAMDGGGLLSGLGRLGGLGFAAFFVLKVAATSFTVGSGGSGGLFAPALVCGGALGAASGVVLKAVFPEAIGIHAPSFALVGMAGFLASALRIPLASIVMVAEISGNHQLLLPAMWVCGISFWLNNDWSLYRSQIRSRESSPVHR